MCSFVVGSTNSILSRRPTAKFAGRIQNISTEGEQLPAITLFWAETTLQAPSYPPGPVSLAPSGLWGCPGGAALQTRAYLALMVLLEVTLRVFGFTSFYPILGLNPGWRLKGLTRAPASDRKHAQLTRAIGGSLVEVPYSSPMKPPSFASNSRLSAELMEATSTAAAVTAPAATTLGAAGGW